MVLVKPHFNVCETAEEACHNAEAIVICTEWDEFKDLDWEKSEPGRIHLGAAWRQS